MKDRSKIEITTYPQFNLSGSLVPPAMQLALIGIGVAVESAAMQWSGFIMFFLFLVAIVLSEEIERRERR